MSDAPSTVTEARPLDPPSTQGNTVYRDTSGVANAPSTVTEARPLYYPEDVTSVEPNAPATATVKATGDGSAGADSKTVAMIGSAAEKAAAEKKAATDKAAADKAATDKAAADKAAADKAAADKAAAEQKDKSDGKTDDNLPPMTGVKAPPFVSKAKASFAGVPTFTVGGSQISAGNLNEAQWKIVLTNTGVFYGWLIDFDTNSVVQAPKPAFRLRTRKTVLAPIPTNPVPTTSAAPAQPSSDSGKTDWGFPKFRVNDASRIEISACESEYELSMARNDFSKTSTQVSLGGTFKGVTVGVSIGHAQSKSTTSKSTDNTYQKTLVARYLYPRYDVFLHADDLEPSPELAQAIDLVKRTRSIKHLRSLHADFGHLFCSNVTLGARLLSTKIITSTVNSTEREQQEQFKVSVGLSVATPKEAKVAAELSVKTENSKGFSEATNTTNTAATDTNVFEAAGGDTILAINPALWAPTVANPDLWRVINRDDLSPLFDLVSKMSGYEQVLSWFVQAVPTLNRYIVLDDGHQQIVRLKLMTPSNGLYLDKKEKPFYYLGHKENPMCTPRQVGISNNPEDYWNGQIAYPSEAPLSVQRRYPNNMVGDTMFGAKYNLDFTQTAWSITGPFSTELTHGCRVVLGTQPFIDPAAKQAVGTSLTPTVQPTSVGGQALVASVGAQAQPPPPPPPPVSFLVVFRNQQGVFLPGMSQSDEVHYWRIMKKDDNFGDYIKEGDELRFSWSFKDQTTGYRDYTDDVFGRRNTKCPPDLDSDTLYMKMPWPRFETGTPHSMLMAPLSSLDTQYWNVPTLPGTFTYSL